MADDSSSEEYVSADEGPEDLQTTATYSYRSSPQSVAGSQSPSSPRETLTVETRLDSNQSSGRDSPSAKPSEEEAPISHHLGNIEEPHPPPTVEDVSTETDKPDAESPPPNTDTSQQLHENSALDKTGLVTSNVEVESSSAGLRTDTASPKSRDRGKSESSNVELNTVGSDANVDVDLSGEKITELSKTDTSATVSKVVESESKEKREREQSQALEKKIEEEGKREEEVREEEKAPVPPPRKKRKHKKLMNKQPSLENLVDTGTSSLQDVEATLLQRSMTVSSTDYRRESKKERQIKKMAATHSPVDRAPAGDTKTTMLNMQQEQGGETDLASPTTMAAEDVQVKAKPIKSGDGPLDRSLRTSRSATPTPAISIEPDGSLELTADMINGIDNEVITSDTLQSAKARGSNNTGLGVIIPSDDESVDGESLLLGEEEEEEEEKDGEMVIQVDGGIEGVAVGGVGGELEGVAAEMLPGSTPQRPRAVSKTSEEGSGHDHERTPQPSDPQEKSLELAKEKADQASAAAQTGSPTDTDNAILESTMIKNLDTGEVMPLSAAEERIPRGHGWSPLSEHLLRRTNQMSADGHLPSLDEDEMEDSQHRGKIKKRLMKFTKWGKRKGRHGDGHLSLEDDTMTIPSEDHQHTVKYKNSSNKQGQLEFDRVRLKQDLTGQHLGAVWSMEFSICGRLLATAGQDSVVRVWVLRTAYHFFHELQSQYQRLGVHSSVDSLSEKASMASNSSKSSEEDDANAMHPFLESPLCAYYGHTADILDISWSKNFFLLSSSMDKTVRLWHISRKECLCCFQHVDFVTAIAFHPRDDRYFLSGSLDGKLRLWNIPDKKVALWNEIEGVGSHLITAANFCMNGKLAVVGTYDGRCIFYETEHLKYHTQIHVRSRHGKNRGRKISGVEPLPGEDKLLVTSNDSRIRLYNLKDHSLSCKYRGCLNTSSQIKATFSRDGQYIISGSEDNFVYVWKTHLDTSKMPSRRDRNEFYESFSTHSAPVTTAVFAPVPGITVDQGLKEVGEMIVAADYQGCIKIYVSNENL